jgi:hypothetical protein
MKENYTMARIWIETHEANLRSALRKYVSDSKTNEVKETSKYNGKRVFFYDRDGVLIARIMYHRRSHQALLAHYLSAHLPSTEQRADTDKSETKQRRAA